MKNKSSLEKGVEIILGYVKTLSSALGLLRCYELYQMYLLGRQYFQTCLSQNHHRSVARDFRRRLVSAERSEDGGQKLR